MSTTYSIDVIAGDGIGQEVMPAAISCVDAVAANHDFTITWRHRDWGSEYYRAYGTMMPADGLEQMATGHGILLGVVGAPDIPDDVTLWGLLIPIRREFLQYVNVRPIRILPGVRSPLRSADHLDLVVVRENVEGEYSEVGGRMYRGRPEELAVQESVFTRIGITRVAEYAATLAESRARRVISATKSNGIIHSMPFWDEVVADVVATHPGVALEKVLIDALAARVVLDRTPSTLLSPPTCSAISRPTWRQRRPVPSASPPARTSTRQAITHRCSNRSMGPPPTSPARASPTRSGRCGRPR